MNCKMLVLSILLFLLLGNLPAQDGSLDPSFGIDGKLISDLGGGYKSPDDILLLPDNKFLIAGTGTDFFILSRYHPDGQLDDSFGSNGKRTLYLDLHYSSDAFLALQQDGKILVSGFTDEDPDNFNLVLVRLNPDGNLDTSFGNDGVQITDLNGYDDYGNGIYVLPNGRILQAGGTLDEMGVINFSLVRYLSDGSLDTSFGVDGKVVTKFPSAKGVATAYNIALQDDLKIVLSGFVLTETINMGEGSDYALARYDRDGTLDQSFGEQGLFVFTTDDHRENGTNLAVQKDQKILVTGQLPFGMIRLNSDGKIDPTFGNGGRIFTPIGDFSSSRDITLQADGKILLTGEAKLDINSSTDFGLARYLPDGNIDIAFGNSGRVHTEFDGFGDYATCITTTDDNKILVVGSSYSDGNHYGLAQYLSSFETHTTEVDFLTEQTTLYPNPVSSHSLLEYTLSQTSTISIDLYEVNGKWIQNILAPTRRAAGIHQEPIQLVSGLGAGNYFLMISDQKENLGIPLVKE